MLKCAHIRSIGAALMRALAAVETFQYSPKKMKSCSGGDWKVSSTRSRGIPPWAVDLDRHAFRRATKEIGAKKTKPIKPVMIGSAH